MQCKVPELEQLAMGERTLRELTNRETERI